MADAPLISQRAIMLAALARVDPTDQDELERFEEAVQASKAAGPVLEGGQE
jgi:hypothetical protein